MVSSIIPKSTDKCITCGAELTGNFCSTCGEKKLNPSKDYSIGKFLEQTIDGFTHFDSKFLRSFRALLFKPGFLTEEFIRGRRTRYMKPVQIFIIASVLFYFLFPTTSTFFASVQDLHFSNKFNFDVDKAVAQKATTDDTTVQSVIKSVEIDAAHKSKAFLFLLIPVWGLAFYMLFWRSSSFLVPHVIFASHAISFLIVLFMVYYLIALTLFGSNINDNRLIPLVVAFLAYLFLAVRRVYQRHLFWSITKTIFALAIFLALFIIYRQGITIWALI